MVLWIISKAFLFRLQDCNLLWWTFPDLFVYNNRSVYDMSATPIKQALLVWAVPRSLAATYGIEFLSIPPGTKMFQFPGFPSLSYVFT